MSEKNTLPILSNVIIEAKNNKLNMVATDLDIVYQDEITDIKISKDGSTITSATVLHDLLRKLPPICSFCFARENKLSITAENSKFNLYVCQ